MNTSFQKHLALFIALGFGIVGSVQAQRGGHRGGGNTGGQIRSFDRGSSRSNQGSSFGQSSSSRQQSNTSSDRQRSTDFNRQNSSVVNSRPASVPTNRSIDRSSQWNGGARVNNNFNRSQSSRTVIVNNTTRVNNSYRYPSRYSYPRTTTPYRYNYAPRRYVYVGAPRYSILPHGALTIRFGGYPYYYHSGLFYSYYDNFYQPVFAPIGIHINILPTGYYPFYVGPTRYYYYDGVYYKNYLDNQYEVIDAPLGTQVSVLPKGATVATVNGEKFYEFNGTYYKEGANAKNEVVYTVVGKYGNIDNTEDTTTTTTTSLPQALHEGDVIAALPDGCKEVTINGEHLYVSPDNTYFRAQTVDGAISYKVVGAASGN